MPHRPFRFLAIALLACCTRLCAQQVKPASGLADDLCSCIGQIDPRSDGTAFNLAVRHCLNSSMAAHAGEVVELMRRFPAQDQRFYLLGLVLGSSLDRNCPQYPLVKERLRDLLAAPAETGPNT